MIAVGPDSISKQTVKAGAFLNGDRMAHIAPIRFLHMLGNGRRKFCQILVESASAGHVQHLNAAADGDKRFF